MRALPLLAALALAGCLAAPTGPGGPEPQAPARLDLGVPATDAAGTAAWHADFVRAYPARWTGSPTNLEAGEFLAAELAAAGWEVRTLEWVPGGVASPSPTGAGVNAIVGVKRGAHEDAVLGWVAHYDVVPATLEGAYDDGSGVAHAVELARAFAAYGNNKTLVVALFDSEEMGLMASNYFVREAVQDAAARWHLALGLDMTGINWPGHAWPMWQFPGDAHVDLLKPVLEGLDRDVLGYPAHGVAVADELSRSSDERSFQQADVPVLRLAGGQNASDYPEYHRPGDTVDFILDFVGGEANWVAGIGTTLESAAWTLALFDRLPHPEDPGFAAAAQALLARLAPVARDTAAGAQAT